jgi:hypothetical protein
MGPFIHTFRIAIPVRKYGYFLWTKWNDLSVGFGVFKARQYVRELLPHWQSPEAPKVW